MRPHAPSQHLHTQSITTRRRCGRNGKHEAPRKLSAHREIGIAAYQVETTVSRVASLRRVEEAVEGGAVVLGMMQGGREGGGGRGLEAGGRWRVEGGISWSGEGERAG